MLALSSRRVSQRTGNEVGDKEVGDPGTLRPLHGGRHNIPPEVLAHNQRERLLAALASCVAENGYNATTIAQITAVASVSRRTFYEHFDGKEECFIAAYEALDGYVETLMKEAARDLEEWPDRVAAAVRAVTAFLASRPNLARIYLVEVAVVGEAANGVREKTTSRFVRLLEPGRRLREVDPGVEEGLVGGIVTLLGRRVRSGEADQLDAFAPAVIEFVLSPYLGLDEARAVIARSA
jgi:AcrR family transcriptional regulator